MTQCQDYPAEKGTRLPTVAEDLASIHRKLDAILAFQLELQPYLPLLEKISSFVDNPASRFRDLTRMRKGNRGASDGG